MLYILDDKKVIRAKDHSEWDAWKKEHEKDCLVKCDYLYGITVRTTFRGYDPMGAGYVFCTQVVGKTMVDGCNAQTYDDALKFHQWTCESVTREHEVNLSRQAHYNSRGATNNEHSRRT